MSDPTPPTAEPGDTPQSPDHPVELTEVPYDQWGTPPGKHHGDFIPLDQVPGNTRDAKIEAGKGQLLGRLTLRAQSELASRATYAFAVRSDARGHESVFVVGRLA